MQHETDTQLCSLVAGQLHTDPVLLLIIEKKFEVSNFSNKIQFGFTLWSREAILGPSEGMVVLV